MHACARRAAAGEFVFAGARETGNEMSNKFRMSTHTRSRAGKNNANTHDATEKVPAAHFANISSQYGNERVHTHTQRRSVGALRGPPSQTHTHANLTHAGFCDTHTLEECTDRERKK